MTVTATGAIDAAYRVGTGSWQSPNDPTGFSFEVSGGGNYDVAVPCGNDVNIYSLTAGEMSSLEASCSSVPTTINYSVQYDVSGVTGAAYAVVFYKNSGTPAVGNGVTDTVSISNGVAGKQDLVVVAMDGNTPPNPIAAKKYTVTINSGDVVDATTPGVTDADGLGVVNFPDFSAQVPSGYASFWMVMVATDNGTVFSAGAGPGSGGSGATFNSLPFPVVYTYMASAGDSSHTVASVAASSSDPSVGVPSVSLPSPIDPTIGGNPVSVGGLAPGSQTVLYWINLNWGTPVSVSALVSMGYLGSNSSYTVPDLTSLSGFSDASPASGDTANVRVDRIDSSQSLQDLISNWNADVIPDGWEFKFSEKIASYQAP